MSEGFRHDTTSPGWAKAWKQVSGSPDYRLRLAVGALKAIRDYWAEGNEGLRKMVKDVLKDIEG